MKYLLLQFFLCPLLVLAQPGKDPAMFFYGSDSLPGTPLKMPVIKSGDLYLYVDNSTTKDFFTLIPDSTYQKIFAGYPPHSLPAINFNTHELMLGFYCIQCLGCKGNGFDLYCHRNACRYKFYWLTREKK